MNSARKKFAAEKIKEGMTPKGAYDAAVKNRSLSHAIWTAKGLVKK